MHRRATPTKTRNRIDQNQLRRSAFSQEWPERMGRALLVALLRHRPGNRLVTRLNLSLNTPHPLMFAISPQTRSVGFSANMSKQ